MAVLPLTEQVVALEVVDKVVLQVLVVQETHQVQAHHKVITEELEPHLRLMVQVVVVL